MASFMFYNYSDMHWLSNIKHNKIVIISNKLNLEKKRVIINNFYIEMEKIRKIIILPPIIIIELFKFTAIK